MCCRSLLRQYTARAARLTPARMSRMPEKESLVQEGRLHTPDLFWVYGAHGLIHAYMFVFPVILALVKEEFGTGWFALEFWRPRVRWRLGWEHFPRAI